MSTASSHWSPWLAAVVVAGAVAAAVFTYAVRNDRVPAALSRVIAGLCGVALVAMVVSDWPGEFHEFWSDHSVLASMLSSTLLVGVVFLAYEARERSQQALLASSVTGTGLGGIVDHMVDAEVAVALAMAAEAPPSVNPEWASWREGKPLRWLREGRELLEGARDPRLVDHGDTASFGEHAPELLDQALRRILAAMRDWSPLIATSEEGTEVLVLLSHIRSSLMRAAENLRSGAQADGYLVRELERVRAQCRVLVWCFEEWSGAVPPRPEVRQGMEGVSHEGDIFPGPVSHRLRKRLKAAESVLREGDA